MSVDIIALCPHEPTLEIILASLVEACPELKVDIRADQKIVQLYQLPAQLVMTTEEPRLVRVRGEVRRLLGMDVDLEPVWWVETHTPARDPAARAVALRFATAVASQTGGQLWATE